MITRCHLDQSRSERIVWLLEELATEDRLEIFLREPELYGPPALTEAHPLGRAPVTDSAATLDDTSPEDRSP